MNVEPQPLIPRPLKDYGDYAKLIDEVQSLPKGQAAFILAVPYVFFAEGEFTPQSVEDMKRMLREQIELAIEHIDYDRIVADMRLLEGR